MSDIPSSFNLEKKIRRQVSERGVTFKFLAAQIGVTEAGLAKMLKNNSIKVETLLKISEVLEVKPQDWFKNERIGKWVTHKIPEGYIVENIRIFLDEALLEMEGDRDFSKETNNRKIDLNTDESKKQEGIGQSIADVLADLRNCNKERENLRAEVETITRELDSLKMLLSAKDEIIKLLRVKEANK